MSKEVKCIDCNKRPRQLATSICHECSATGSFIGLLIVFSFIGGVLLLLKYI